jgi:hypothetical protein
MYMMKSISSTPQNPNQTPQNSLVLYLFLVGVELDPEVLQRNGRKAIMIAAVGIALPFGLGCLISPLLFHKLLIPEPGYENAHYGSFLVFVSTFFLKMDGGGWITTDSNPPF